MPAERASLGETPRQLKSIGPDIGTGIRHAGASFPQVRMAKKPNWPTNRLERLALQHELLAFSGCAGLRLFASFLKLDQGFRIKRSPALKTHSILQTIGWSEVSSLKVMNACVRS